MKYLLVAQSLKKYTDLEEYCMPLGIAYINGAMRSCGFDVDAINMLFEDDPLEALRSRIMDKKIDVLMCGGLFFCAIANRNWCKTLTWISISSGIKTSHI